LVRHHRSAGRQQAVDLLLQIAAPRHRLTQLHLDRFFAGAAQGRAQLARQIRDFLVRCGDLRLEQRDRVGQVQRRGRRLGEDRTFA
jgi:hypothetical protein